MKVIVNKLAIEYEDSGTGPVILMLHGWQDNIHTFDNLTSKFQDRFRVIRVDLPGFGRSDTPKKAWSMSDYSDFLEAFVEKLNLSVFSVIGHSFGGRLILKSIGENKLEVDRVVLLASAGIIKSASFKNKLMRIVSKIFGPILKIPPLSVFRNKIRKKVYSSMKSDYLDAGQLQETFVQVINEDLTHYAKNINKPTLLIYGENDESTPVSDGEKINSLIDGSELYVIKEAGHFVHIEQFDQVCVLIDKFINQ